MSILSLSRINHAVYRFHKKIGKGRWNRYIERFIPCRSIENTQRLIYNYPPTFTASRNSCSYLWQLPKLIALSTTANQVLDAWNLYRSKRKPPYLYLKALKRLADIGGCDTSDYRFTLITSRIARLRNSIINLPRFFHYLGKLKCAIDLENLTKFIIPKLHYYTPSQLALIANSFANCKLHDKYLFRHLSKSFKSIIHKASAGNLLRMGKAYAECAVFDYRLMGMICLYFTNLLKGPKESVPCFKDIVQMSSVFSQVKYRCLEFYRIVSLIAINELDSSPSPLDIFELLKSFTSAKVNDIPLFLKVLILTQILADVKKRHYEYPPQWKVLPMDDENPLNKYIIPQSFDTEVERFDYKKWVYHNLDKFEPQDLAITMKRVKKTQCEDPRVNRLANVLVRKLDQMKEEFSPGEYRYLKQLYPPITTTTNAPKLIMDT